MTHKEAYYENLAESIIEKLAIGIWRAITVKTGKKQMPKQSVF